LLPERKPLTTPGDAHEAEAKRVSLFHGERLQSVGPRARAFASPRHFSV
jgi:hypothetical protein